MISVPTDTLAPLSVNPSSTAKTLCDASRRLMIDIAMFTEYFCNPDGIEAIVVTREWGGHDAKSESIYPGRLYVLPDDSGT
jgi:hypothetical protein